MPIDHLPCARLPSMMMMNAISSGQEPCHPTSRNLQPALSIRSFRHVVTKMQLWASRATLERQQKVPHQMQYNGHGKDQPVYLLHEDIGRHSSCSTGTAAIGSSPSSCCTCTRVGAHSVQQPMHTYGEGGGGRLYSTIVTRSPQWYSPPFAPSIQHHTDEIISKNQLRPTRTLFLDLVLMFVRVKE